jgi:hypothetical protein
MMNEDDDVEGGEIDVDDTADDDDLNPPLVNWEYSVVGLAPRLRETGESESREYGLREGDRKRSMIRNRISTEFS